MDRNALRLPDPASRASQEERRRTVRQKLHSPVYVSFNGPQSGMVVDLSELLDLHESGFAVQTAIPTGTQRNDRLEVNRAVTLCLDLPETRKFVHGSGQVMWTDDTGRAGIRFSFLPDSSRQILKEWLFANLLVASTNYAARSEQLAHRRQEESPAHELPAEDSRARDSSPNDTTRAPAPTLASIPTTSVLEKAAAALPDRAALLSALDDVRRQVRQIESREIQARGTEAGDLAADADLVLRLVTERVLSLTGATGAALALLTGDRMLCRARAGDPAPPLGSEVDVRAGLSGECIRSGLLVTCEDPETDPRVDPEICRTLGIGSFMAAPIFKDFRVAGLLEIFSPHPRSFTQAQATILERLVELVPESRQKSEKRRIEKEVSDSTPDGSTPDGETGASARPSEQCSPAATNQLQASSAASLPSHLGVDAVVRPSVQDAPAPQPDLAPPDLPQPDLEDVPTPASRSGYFHLGLLGLVLAVVCLVLGYLLAPTIERRWPHLAQSSQISGRASSQISSASSASLQDPADRRSRVLSPADLRKLAEQGDAEAQYQLGILYHDGDVVPKDDAQAVQWFQRAAEQGYVRAQSTLGAYYWAGRGVPQDFSKAYFWSQLALAQGDENSKSRLEGLAAQMTRTQVANARQQAEAWLHSHTQTTNSKAN